MAIRGAVIFQILDLSKGLYISVARIMAVFIGNVNGIYKSLTKVTANMTMSVTTTAVERDGWEGMCVMNK